MINEWAKVIAPRKANNNGNKIASSFNQINKKTIEMIDISHIINDDLTYLINVRFDDSPYKNVCCSKIEGILCQNIK